MQKFVNYFVSYDAYGEPVQLSYRGDSTYKTPLGACLTLAMQGFMLIFIVTGVIALVNYEGPQITQYTIYDNRTDGREINLGEASGDLLIGFYDTMNPNPTLVSCDPRICV